ncbi:MAG: cytochrome P450 [Actinobacteria bacterium]|nr:cytochrome P450 [Actinomycetota bacterium]
MTGNHEPVADWATDFDHTDLKWAADPFPIWDDLRESCPVAHSERYGGVWLPTRHEDVAAIAYDTEHFSSSGIIVSDEPQFMGPPVGMAPPITSDPPFHAEARRLILQALGPKAVAELEPITRAWCEELLDRVSGQPVIDAAADYAENIPGRIVCHILGFPLEDADLLKEYIQLELVDMPFYERPMPRVMMFEYLRDQVMDHVANPRDDLTSHLLASTHSGEPLELTHVGGTMALLIIAGIDTTWSSIGAALWHLAQHPDDRDRLIKEPDLMPIALEELLRAYAPVTMARKVVSEVEIGGCPMKPGDWVLLPFPSANRDPEHFDRADEVVIDRAENRHATFGLGIHRCAGSNLARMEMRVALETWLDRYPTFTLDDPGGVRWAGGQVRGPRALALRVA